MRNRIWILLGSILAVLMGVSCDDSAGATSSASAPATQTTQSASSYPADEKTLQDDRIGKWHYRMYLKPWNSRSAETIGEISFDGKPVEGMGTGPYMWTPWGKMIYFERGAWKRGWLPHTIEHPAPKGDELPSPDTDTSKLVRERYETLSKSPETFRLGIAYGEGLAGGSFSIATSFPIAEYPPGWKHWQVEADKNQMQRVIDSLAEAGVLARAFDPRLINVTPQKRRRLDISFQGVKDLHLICPLEPDKESLELVRRIFEHSVGIDPDHNSGQAAQMLKSLADFVDAAAPASKPASTSLK